MVDDFNELKKARRAKQLEKRRNYETEMKDRVLNGLLAVWQQYAEETKKTPVVEGGFPGYSDRPPAVFSSLQQALIQLAQVHDMESDAILEILIPIALTCCEPKGRLYVLLNKAADLLQFNDEDGSEKAIRELHARGKLTDEELQRELTPPE